MEQSEQIFRGHLTFDICHLSIYWNVYLGTTYCWITSIDWREKLDIFKTGRHRVSLMRPVKGTYPNRCDKPVHSLFLLIFRTLRLAARGIVPHVSVVLQSSVWIFDEKRDCLQSIFSLFIYGAQRSKRQGVSERGTTRSLGSCLYFQTKTCKPTWKLQRAWQRKVYFPWLVFFTVAK